MIDLIAKLNATVEPDRELDLAIHLAIDPDGDIAKLIKYPRGLTVGEGMHWDIWRGGSVVFERRDASGRCNYNGGYPLPSYTGSIDAAMSLVPSGLLVTMTVLGDKASVSVKTGSIINPETKEWQAYGFTPAAISAAALKARAAIYIQERTK